ncbi:hypothetical protein GSI_07949 [Ganoderma sinense ZZ0214-1]|uniref:Methyltransferase domain-containing protein n=1 Tax=Ganoderma sinense ZZ0214-1 TaxID=1077348 RepID=A0A2G8S8H5_9APHY|nr:hypothetical protein GSI_07949 [Ganoderma sinense ZZ0214-1]
MSYVPPKDERKFFKKTIGIDDDAELDQHILDVQAKAYLIFPYSCIRIFGFTRIRISRLPAYEEFMKLGRERTNPIFIDLGCAFGSDLRKAVLDGYPIESCLATDLHGGLYKEGHSLFRDTPDTFPVPFLQGDVLDPAFLAIPEPLPMDAIPTEPVPSLTGLTSLNPLRGHVSAVYLGKFLHVFDEAGQAHIARALAGLLSPESGSILFGVQGALEERGPFSPACSDWTMFCHSPESLGRLFEDAFGGPGRIRFESRMVEEPGGPTYFDRGTRSRSRVRSGLLYACRGCLILLVRFS